MVGFIGLVSVVGIFALCFILFFVVFVGSRKSQFCVDDDSAFEILKVIEALREICPVGSSQGWSLIANHCSLRCWQRIFPLKFFGSNLMVYGSSVRVDVPSVAVLNVIADVTTWPEWDPEIHHHPLQAEISDDAELHGDKYMQCDQLVAMTVDDNSKPGILMHRFGNLEKNGVGWILLWHIKHLNWCFFLAQPLETSGGIESNSCLLTTILGKTPLLTSKEDLALQMATKLRNLKDAVTRSRLDIRPFVLISSGSNLNNPHLPTIQSALNDLSNTPCVLLQSSSNSLKLKIQVDTKKNDILSMVPFSTVKPITISTVKGFVLVAKNLKTNDKKEGEQKEKANIRQRNIHIESTYQESENKKEQSSSISSNAIIMPTVTITQPDDDPDFSKKSSFRNIINETRRLSDSSLSDRDASLQSNNHSSHPKSPFQGFRARSKSADSRLRTKCHKKASSDQESGHTFLNTLFARAKKLSISANNISKSTSDVFLEDSEKLTLQDKKKQIKEKQIGILNKSDINLSKGNNEDFKYLGDTCISDLLLEVKSAFKDVINVPNIEPKTHLGKWICHSNFKDLTIITRIQDIPTQNIISYLGHGVIQAQPTAVWNFVSNPQSHFIYDETVKKVNIIQNLSSEQKIVHIYHEITTLMKKEMKDFCLLQTSQKKNSKFILAYQSIQNSLCPPNKEIVRGTMLCSGWIIESMKKNRQKCSVTFLKQMIVDDPDCLLVEMTGNVHTQSIPHLRSYFVNKPF